MERQSIAPEWLLMVDRLQQANATPGSRGDPDANLPAGLVVQSNASEASGNVERKVALATIDRHDPGSQRQITLGAHVL